MAARHAEGLGELARMGLEIARKLHGAVMAAETPEEVERLSGAFHRMSRSVRQSFALEARLERDRQRALAEDRRAADERRAAAVAQRRRLAGAELERLVWTENERPDSGISRSRAGERLNQEAADEDRFLEGAVEDLVIRILRDIGLAAFVARVRPASSPPATTAETRAAAPVHSSA